MSRRSLISVAPTRSGGFQNENSSVVSKLFGYYDAGSCAVLLVSVVINDDEACSAPVETPGSEQRITWQLWLFGRMNAIMACGTESNQVLL